MTTLGPLARLALARVPDRWRDSVARDISDEAARKRLSGVRRDLWLAWQILRVAARFSREDRRKVREAAAGRATSWNLGTDLRLAVRSVRREPASAIAVMCTLALGTGAVTATYAVVNYAILRPMPGVADESRLVSVYTQVDPTTAHRGSASFAHLVAMRDHTPALTGLAGWNYGDMALTLDPAQPPRMASLVSVTRGFFDVLGVRPRLGRLFTADEYDVTGGNLLVISERLWRRTFNDDPSIVGRRILVGSKPFEIIGVARAFQGLDRLRHDDGWLAVGSGGYAPTNMVGRLAPGATIASAQSQLTAAFRAVGESRIGDRTFWPFAFPGLTDGIGLSKSRMMAVFRVMLAGVALLLVLACANAANLMLARHLRRSADLAVRHALGASRGRLLRELLVEAGAMSIGAGVLGLGLAALLTSLFRTSRLLSYLPVLDTLSLDWRVAAFCAAVSAATIVLFALVPAMLASRADIRATVAAGARTTRRAGWLRTSLVGAQVALSFTLVVVAALLAQSVHRLQTVDFGFEPDRVLAFSFRPTRAGYDDDGTAAAMQRVHDRLAATPGISGVALAFFSPLGGTSGSSIRLPGQDDAHAIKMSSHDVTGEYFSVLGIPVLQGRTFSPSESWLRRSDGAPIILNDTLARKLFGAAPAVGREILQQGRSARGVTWRSRTIIGIVGSVVGSDVREGIKPFAYEPFGGSRISTVLVRPAGRVEGVAGLVRQVARDAAPDVPVDDITPLRVEANEEIAQERVLSRLSLVIGAIAGLLALAGLYAAVAQFVGERTREFAIRAAIGASRPVIAGTILRRVIRIAFGGLAVGALLVIALTSLLATYLFGVSARDPATIVAAAVALTAASLAAAWPAVRRAMRVDPASALRSD
jgi:putative ABC transport system permease protein